MLSHVKAQVHTYYFLVQCALLFVPVLQGGDDINACLVQTWLIGSFLGMECQVNLLDLYVHISALSDVENAHNFLPRFVIQESV